MTDNIVILYKKNKDIFDEILKTNLVNPKKIMSQNDKGQTVLHHLILSQDNKCVENVLNFISNNASTTEKQKFIDAQDKDGNTAFHIATQKKNFEIASLLDIYGANKKIPNNNNEIIFSSESSDFTDSSSEIKYDNKQKIDDLIKNIIKPTKNYNMSETQTPETLDDIILPEEKKGNFLSNFLDNIFGTSKINQNGGELNSSTSEFLKYIDNKINQNGGYSNSDSDSISDLNQISISSFNFLEGGAKKNKKTKKQKKNYSASREVQKADKIHEEVVKMIQDLGYPIDEAKAIKAALYKYTRNQHPELNNYERAEKMKSYATKKHIADLDPNAVKEALEIMKNKKSKI